MITRARCSLVPSPPNADSRAFASLAAHWLRRGARAQYFPVVLNKSDMGVIVLKPGQNCDIEENIHALNFTHVFLGGNKSLQALNQLSGKLGAEDGPKYKILQISGYRLNKVLKI